MPSLNRFVNATLTTLTLFVGTVIYLSKPASADEVYIDNNCRRNQSLPQEDRFKVFYSSQIRANAQDYLFYAGRYQDGSAIFCISRPGFRETRALSARQIQNQFIDKIVKVPNRTATFIVTVAEGNGSRVPLTDYRIGLNNPNRPVVTRLRSRLGRM
ncbi:hypothetical protein [Microcoleus sp. FACHB-831]|uniref:hypothetical protein n=1 Tax=Microcoleus sp. FACHB-831 TaxID=2692827 RepID=UPI0016854E56|nr:hypothetical protein [Microcoleus sp. FACHB-831]